MNEVKFPVEYTGRTPHFCGVGPLFPNPKDPTKKIRKQWACNVVRTQMVTESELGEFEAEPERFRVPTPAERTALKKLAESERTIAILNARIEADARHQAEIAKAESSETPLTIKRPGRPKEGK